jgi:hypothetical protein
MRSQEGGKDFNEVVQRMMFKCGVTRIGPFTGDELNNQLDAAFASGKSYDFRFLITTTK